jgi:hypothetical protein
MSIDKSSVINPPWDYSRSVLRGTELEDADMLLPLIAAGAVIVLIAAYIVTLCDKGARAKLPLPVPTLPPKIAVSRCIGEAHGEAEGFGSRVAFVIGEVGDGRLPISPARGTSAPGGQRNAAAS